MSHQSADLRLLLQLMEGRLPPADESRLRERMLAERALRQRWQQLNHLKQQPESAIATEPDGSMDDVAAFLDGLLPPDQEQDFEQRCWQSPALLSEVIALSELADAPTANNLADSQLTKRLLKLAASATSDLAPANSPDEQDKQAADRVISPWLLAVALAACILISAVMWFSRRSPDTPQLAGDSPTQPESEHGPEPKGPMVVNRSAAPPGQQPDVVPAMPESQVPSPVPSVPDTNPVQPVDPSGTIAAQPPAAAPEIDHPAEPFEEIEWKEIQGLVAARLSVRDSWRGLRARRVPRGANFATLSGSRCVAAGPDGIDVVLAEDTEIEELTWLETPQVRVLSGRVAFRGVPAGMTVRFLVGDQTWEATSRSDNAAVSLDLTGPRSVLAVHRGQFDVGKRRLRRYQYVVRSDRPTVQSVASGVRPEFSGWVNAWQASVPVPADVRDALLRSDNLRQDLQRLAARQRLPAATVDRLLLTVAPETRVFRLLNSHLAADRNVALLWLLQHPVDAPGGRGALAWRTLTTQLRNETYGRLMHEWLRRVREGLPAEDQLDEMYRCLQSQPVAVRHVAIYCLRYFTGQDFGYSPAATRTRNAAALRQWRSYLQARQR